MPEAETYHKTQEAIDRFKESYGIDVNVKCQWFDGVYYKDKPVSWFAESDRFWIGPESTLVGALEKLRQLHGPTLK